MKLPNFKMEPTLQYLTHHSEAIIQWLFLAILGLSALIIARALFGRRESGGEMQGGEVHVLLQRILDQTQKLESMPLSAAGAAGVADVDVQVQALMVDLKNREAEIAKLKAAGGAAPAGGAGADPKIVERLKELEAKLSEYEILEDDIADLSLYKEENARLRTELDRMKGSSAPAADMSAAVASPAPDAEIVAEASAAPAPMPPLDKQPIDASDLAADLAELQAAQAVASPAAPEATGESIVEEFAQTVTAEIPTEPGAMSMPLADTGDPMADFESTVNMEKGETPTAAPKAQAPSPAPLQAVASSEASVAPADQAEVDDLFAEFSEEHGGGLNTDKMMEEMASLNIEPSTDNALEENTDIDKMAQEAAGFGKS